LENLDAQLKSGVVAAQIEVSDASSDIAETKSKAAIALARARLQRHKQFENIVVPTLLRMMKKSANNKVICTVFALAGLHIVEAFNKDFNLSPMIDSALVGAGTYFGYEVISDSKHKEAKHAALATTDLDCLVEAMRKLDRKATIKLVSLAALNCYDSPPLTQAAVLSAVGFIATVLPYALILGIKYADMKGLDWQTWQGESTIAKCWQKTGLPKLAGTALIGVEKSAQAVLPYAGRTAKAVAAGRLIIKGLTMFAPVEAQLDALLENSSLLYEYGFKGLAWGATGVVTGYGAYPLFTRMKHCGREILRRSGSTPPPHAPSLEKASPLPVSDHSLVPH
jgi:hypothetical protein